MIVCARGQNSWALLSHHTPSWCSAAATAMPTPSFLAAVAGRSIDAWVERFQPSPAYLAALAAAEEVMDENRTLLQALA